MSEGTDKPKPAPPGQQGEDSYFEKGALKSKYVSRGTMEPMAQGMASDGLNMTQLNRFFRHCRQIQFRLKRGESTWDQESPEVELLSAHAADAAGKEQKIPESFRRFIDGNVSRVRTEADFVEGFMKHFEALMGFASLYAKKGQRGRTQ
jgi:CRISPR type III-A-associated protein Csm2